MLDVVLAKLVVVREDVTVVETVVVVEAGLTVNVNDVEGQLTGHPPPVVVLVTVTIVEPVGVEEVVVMFRLLEKGGVPLGELKLQTTPAGSGELQYRLIE